MKTTNSLTKRIFAAGLAFAVLLNTACRYRTEDGTKAPISASFERHVREDAGSVRGEVNPVEPVLTEDFVDDNGNRTLTFEFPSDGADDAEPTSGKTHRLDSPRSSEADLVEQQREYLRGHAQRLEKAREACRSMNCDGIPGLDSSSSGRVRIGRDDAEPSLRAELKTKEDVLREIERLEKELTAERKKWEEIRSAAQQKQSDVVREHNDILATLERSTDEAVQSAREENKLSELVYEQLTENHNEQTEKLYESLGLDPRQGADAAHQAHPIQNPETPYQAEVERLKQANILLRATSLNTALNDSSESLADLAEASARRGQLDSFDVRMESARTFASASQHKGNTDASALKAALELSAGAKSLDAQGLSALADESAKMAGDLLHAAIDVARLANVIDVPLSLMEAFSGKTVDFTSEGQIFLRDCSVLERGFALGTLVLGTGGVLGGAAPIALAAVALGKLLKAFKEQSVAVHGAAAGAKVFEQITAAAREIDRTAPHLMAETTLTPYAKKHIWLGKIRVSHDAHKVRIDGGLHTQDGLQKYLDQAPIENQPVSRELLSNGVERVVFPDSALTNKSISDMRIAAENGFGMPNGKTIFPAAWTPEKIEAAIQKAITEGEIVSRSDKGFRKMARHDGVTVIVNLGADGRINSAFPRWEQ